MVTWRSIFMVNFALALMLFSAACNDGVGFDGALVGGGCESDRDCDPDARCVRGKDYPSGTCTVSCRSDRDCPESTFCIDKEGGICLLGCEINADCREQYFCDKKDLKSGGKQLVCIGD